MRRSFGNTAHIEVVPALVAKEARVASRLIKEADFTLGLNKFFIV